MYVIKNKFFVYDELLTKY